jgi:hypothetical protein
MTEEQEAWADFTERASSVGKPIGDWICCMLPAISDHQRENTARFEFLIFNMFLGSCDLLTYAIYFWSLILQVPSSLSSLTWL